MTVHQHSNRDIRTRSSRRARTQWVFGGLVAMALVLLTVEHRAHLLGWLPWLFLLACPLMHFFMHGGHRHGGHNRDRDSDRGDGQ